MPTRSADLATVGVAAEHEADALLMGDFEDLRAMTEENPGECCWGALEGGFDIMNSEYESIINTCEGKGVWADLDVLRLIDEKANTLGLEGFGEVQTVVVAEDAVEELRFGLKQPQNLHERTGLRFVWGEASFEEVTGDDSYIAGDLMEGFENYG